MSDLERVVESIMSKVKTDTDVTFDSYKRELRNLHEELSHAEQLFLRGLNAVRSQIRRLYDVMPELQPEGARMVQGQGQLPREPREPMPKLVQQGPRNTTG